MLHGGRLTADYDSYQLFEVNQLPAGLLKKQNYETRDAYNGIDLNAGRLDTIQPASLGRMRLWMMIVSVTD